MIPVCHTAANLCNIGKLVLVEVIICQPEMGTIISRNTCQRNSKIPKGRIEIVKSEDRQDHGQQNKTKDKHRTHDITLKTEAGVTRTL